MKRSATKSRTHTWIGLLLVLVLAGVGWRFRTVAVHRQTRSAAAPAPLRQVNGDIPPGRLSHVFEVYNALPLHFEANRGQTDARVDFLARGAGYTLFLTPTETVMVLSPPAASKTYVERTGAPRVREGDATQKSVAAVLRVKLNGANPKPQGTGLDLLPDKSNYFHGSDPKAWRNNVSQYARVEYRDVYPNVDLVYYGNQGRLENDFVIAPGGDPRAIVLSLSGADKLEIDSEGDLLLHTSNGSVRQRKPVAYQKVDGVRRTVPCSYKLEGDTRVGFRLGSYDATRALVIDPVVIYSTYLGGTADDRGFGIAVDVAGNAYLTGRTSSPDFPTAAALQPGYGGGDFDAFVVKLNATGSALVYSTYLGGADDDEGTGIAVDANANVYVTGLTASTNFPIVNALQPANGGGPYDVFVTKLIADGSAPFYSTYLGRSGDDEGSSIAADANGSAYIVGQTSSPDFPTAGAFQQIYGGGPYDAFVAKLSADGSGLVYSTFLGGSGDDEGYSLALDAGGNAYVTGATSSATDFPLFEPLQPVYGGGGFDAFVTVLNSVGSGLFYSTYFGGSGGDIGWSIAVDANGGSYVTGLTNSMNFPTQNALQPGYGGGLRDAFLLKGM